MRIDQDCVIEAIVSTDKERPVISEPFLDLSDKERPVLISTNGAAIAVVPVQVDDGDTQGPVNKCAFKVGRKHPYAKKTGILFVGLNVSGHCTLSDFSTMQRNGNFPEGGNFPEWRNGIPKLDSHKKTVTIRLDSELLANLARSMGTKGVKLEFNIENDGTVEGGIHVTPAGKHYAYSDAYGVIMPMRIK